jgi:hypothetical protein
MSPRANPASEFDAQLPAPQRDPLAFIVSFCFHTILILVILLATRKLHEAQEERRNHQPAQPQREVQMVYVPPPPVARPPTPVAPPQPQQETPLPRPLPPRVIRPPEPEPNAPTEAERTEGREATPQPQEIAQSPEPEGDPTADAEKNTESPPPMVDPAQALNASMEAEAQRIFGRRRGGTNENDGPVATRPFANAKIPDSKCPDIPRDSVGKPVEGLVRGRVVDQETGRPLSNAHLQMIDHPFNTFADAAGNFTLRFDLQLMADCRTQFVRIESPGHRAMTLPIVMGGGISTVPLRRR